MILFNRTQAQGVEGRGKWVGLRGGGWGVGVEVRLREWGLGVKD